ncbi:maleylpyruvate isomerase family mycothiol-dependent enzyme [Nocardioides albidus]|uniref:Maleylpyruvate isomerase family mycothiol-dependent enzyme n=2 Tax=Nocardioides albidus TaxID=1517589 RepID=A0A5C4VS79_9ACTN|nr:maleylpyruvate isomerase family mycothiol-dependent enzyme [Nocardioides albidus]
MVLAAEEYRRFADAVGGLAPEAWTRPTACPAWDVRQMTAHVVGMAEMMAGIREGRRQQRIAGTEAAAQGIAFIDALTALQVRERSGHSPERLVADARRAGRRAARARRMAPSFLRRRDIGMPQVVQGVEESWALGYMVDVILTRDTWMHRSDIALATDTEMRLTAEHDGRIIADVVAEWAQRHGAPYRLTLTGPVGGTWSHGTGGEEIELDAVQFCRVLSGRGSGSGLLATEVPF